MTQIKKMVMSGFKSFATKTELVFGDNFNCVLGPNGCGKSNVIDSLCFVLGKGSTKELRAERAANLIYNGGKTKQPAKEGSVSIYFDNSDKSFPTEEKVVKITRIVRQTGQSKYKINDKVRTRQEVLDLLSIARVDPDGYNIILQGDIEKFVNMPTVKRREIIEEISGIGIYENKKNKAINELNRVEEKLNNAQIILSERKTYLDELKNERDQALKFKGLDEKIKQNKATVLDYEIKKKKSEFVKFEKDIQNQKDIVKKLYEEIGSINKNIAEKRQAIQKINKEIEEKGEKKQLAIHKQVEQLKEDVIKNRARIEVCNGEVKKVIDRKEQLQKTLSDNQQRMDNLIKERQELVKAKQDKEKQMQDLHQKIQAFRKKSNIGDLSELDAEIEKYDTQAEEKEKEVQKYRTEQQELLRSKDRIEIQIESIDEKIYKVKEIEKEHKKELDKLKQLKDEFKQATLELNKRLDEDSSLALQIRDKKDKLEKISEIITRLRAKTIESREAVSANIAVKTILKNKQRFGDVYGTVSQLGSVDSKYALALVGVATFLPLNKIQEPRTDAKIKTYLKANGVHGLTTNLVNFDSKFKKVFKYVFGNTIIVDDINVTRRIGIGNARMATLDGDIAELSGAMRGGFRQKKGASFKQKGADEELKKAENEEAQLQNVLSTLMNRREENENLITELRQKKGNLEGETIKIEKSLHIDSKDVDASKKVKGDFEKEFMDVNKQLEVVENNISEVNKKLAEIKVKKQQVREKVSGLRDPRKLAELNAFDQKKDELKEEITTLTGEIKNIGVQIEIIFGPEEQNTLKIIKQHDKEQEDFKQEINELRAAMSKQTKKLKDKEKAEEEFGKKFKSLFTKKNTLNEDIQKVERDIIRKEEQINKFDEKASDKAILNVRIKAELAGLETEFKKYEGVQLVKKSLEQLKKEITQYENMVEQMGTVNMRALEAYENIEKEYNQLIQKKEKLAGEKEDVFKMMDEIEIKKKDLFMKTFNIITQNFKTIFSELSTKGDAFLELENPESVFDGGVRIKVRITSKKFLDIRSLSGGEKTLTALAFIFCIQEHEPGPFYVLDEVDAALDKRNSELFAKLIAKYSRNAQYLIISHNDGVISEADNLYGVTMNQHGMSKVVSLRI